MNDNTPLTVAQDAAKQAGAVLMEHYAQNITSEYKGPNDIVTAADLAAEKAIITVLEQAFPTHSIYSEETGSVARNSDYTWIIDPLDGTTNFTCGIARFSVAIALQKVDALEVAVVYNPLTEQLYSAQAGQGAFYNGEPLSVDGHTTDLQKAVITMSRGTSPEEKKRHGQLYARMLPAVRSIRVLNSAALDGVGVASGRLVAHINNGCNYYDYAAPALIAQEAGALVTTFTNEPLAMDPSQPSDVLIAPPALHAELVALLAAT